MSMEFEINASNILSLLEVSDSDDIDTLVDYITDKGKGRISLDDDVCKKLVACREKSVYSDWDKSLVAYEIHRFGGNTLANIARDVRHAWVPYGSLLDDWLPSAKFSIQYAEIVRDVASHLKVSVNKESTVPFMEDGILRKLLSNSFEKMSNEEEAELLKALGINDIAMLGQAATATTLLVAKKFGFKTYQIAVIVANAVSKAIIGRGLPFSAAPVITRLLKVAIGPIGWVLTGLWTVADLASPAYRVTVPCVVQIAYMRQKALMKAYAIECDQCGEINDIAAKFCSECGAAMQSPVTEKSVDVTEAIDDPMSESPHMDVPRFLRSQ